MALTTSYLSSTKNIDSIFNSIIGARAPERFTVKFLEDLGFKSSTDRLIIGILKALGLLEDSGVPTQRYFDFLDQSQSKNIIAQGTQEAYEDLFNLRKDAQVMSNDEVKNKLKTLTQGQKSERVIELMAMTFRALCNYADWSRVDTPLKTVENKSPEILANENIKQNLPIDEIEEQGQRNGKMNLHYNIQIHLP
ncbi:MAG: DUF5343 domain-containing protein [Defluviitaleaceae bacterium]|nr:DUF5343 domain-containing protein [Defluviitaleaceae bacterium]